MVDEKDKAAIRRSIQTEIRPYAESGLRQFKALKTRTKDLLKKQLAANSAGDADMIHLYLKAADDESTPVTDCLNEIEAALQAFDKADIP